MSSTDQPVTETASTGDADVDADAAICACGHRLDRHDRIAARFCQATVAGVLPRSCICAGAK
jgi:hypothetical protein